MANKTLQDFPKEVQQVIDTFITCFQQKGVEPKISFGPDDIFISAQLMAGTGDKYPYRYDFEMYVKPGQGRYYYVLDWPELKAGQRYELTKAPEGFLTTRQKRQDDNYNAAGVILKIMSSLKQFQEKVS